MTVSLKIISLFFLILYSSYVFRIVFPLIDYAVNYSFIVHELCEQKDNLDNLCMGKCHLQKEIKKSIEHSSDRSDELVLLNLIDIPHNFTSNIFYHIRKTSKVIFYCIYLAKISNDIEPVIPPPKF